MDAANNPITTFGKYGNEDSGGRDAAIKEPAIPLAWTLTVAVGETHACAAYTLSRRVVRVRIGFAAAERCETE